MSHLPAAVLAEVTALVQALDERLQAETHKVTRAIEQHRAFDQAYVESPLTRSLLCSGVKRLAAPTMRVDELRNGGCEVATVHDGTEWRFRFRKATKDAAGRLDVRVSSDSLLTQKMRDYTLFGDYDGDAVESLCPSPLRIVAYLLNPLTRTFSEVFVALPVGFRNERPPYRLLFGDILPVPLAPPPPAAFRGSDDDLTFDDEADDGTDEADGTDGDVW